MWKFLQSDKNGTPAIFEDGMQVVTQFTCPPLLPQKNIIFGQKFTTDGIASGPSAMNVAVGVNRTDGVVTSGSVTLTSATSNFTGATHITIADTGDIGNAILGEYKIVTHNSVTSIDLDRIPCTDSDTGVDLSINNSTFYIKADPDDDVYITNISVICGYGTTADLFEFADKGTALTNGILIAYDHPTKGSVTIANPKVNYDFIRMGLVDVCPTSWQIQSLVANNDYGWIVNLPLSKIMPPYGIKLDRGTTEKMSITIRDDCSSADVFNMRAFGFERFE